MTARSRWPRLATWLFSIYAYVAAWTVGAMVLIDVLVLGILRANGVAVNLSGLQFGLHAVIWVGFGTSVAMVYHEITSAVAGGFTRRSLTIAALVAGCASALIFGTAVTALLGLEAWIYRLLGWEHGFVEGNGLTELHLGGFWLGYSLLLIAAQVTAALIAVTYYRTGSLVGTFLLPLAAAPLLAVGFLSLDPGINWLPWSWALGQPQVVGVAIAVSAIAAGIAAVTLLLRRVPVHA